MARLVPEELLLVVELAELFKQQWLVAGDFEGYRVVFQKGLLVLTVSLGEQVVCFFAVFVFLVYHFVKFKQQLD